MSRQGIHVVAALPRSNCMGKGSDVGVVGAVTDGCVGGVGEVGAGSDAGVELAGGEAGAGEVDADAGLG